MKHTQIVFEWSTLKLFLKEKGKLKKNTGNVAGQSGFGMSATTGNDYDKKMDEAYAQSMTNFSAGHTNTTSTIGGLTGFRARAHICAQANNKPPCELAISSDLAN